MNPADTVLSKVARILALLVLLLLITKTVSGNPTSAECAAMKSHYNSVGYSEQQRLLRSCEDTYTPGAGWTNSATGCGRCPTGYSSANSAFCENSPSTCAEVAALGAMQDAVVQIGQGIMNNYLRAAVEKIENTKFDFVSDEEFAGPSLYTKTHRVSPSVGDTLSVGVNEVVTRRSTGFYSDCVVPLFEHSKKKLGGWTHSVKGNMPLCKMKEKDKNYHGLYFNVIKEATGQPAAAYAYSIKEKKKGIDICQKAMGMSADCSKKRNKEEFIFGKGFVMDRRDPSQELFYRGANSELVHLESVSADSSRKFSIDRSQGAIFSCGGFELEIIYADGDAITFNRRQGSPTDFDPQCDFEIPGDFPSLAEEEGATLQDRIKSLSEMRNLGLLSEEEFEKKRQEILSEI